MYEAENEVAKLSNKKKGRLFGLKKGFGVSEGDVSGGVDSGWGDCGVDKGGNWMFNSLSIRDYYSWVMGRSIGSENEKFVFFFS